MRIPENIEFKLVQTDEQKVKAWEDRLIEEHNVPGLFTISNFMQTVAQNKKGELENSGQLKIDSAAVENIEEHHPFIKTMSEEDIFTTALYYQYKKSVVECEKKAKMFEEVNKENETKLEIIYAQLPDLKVSIDSKSALERYF